LTKDDTPAEHNDPARLLWRRVARAEHAPRSKLNFAAIAAAAVRKADAEGLDSLTLRRLASELDVATMTLYRYVSSKDEVFELMADAVEVDLATLPSSTDWREALRAFAQARRAGLRKHPWIVELPPRAQAALTPRRFAALEAGFAAFDSVEMDIGAKKAILDVVTAYTTGVALAETARLRFMAFEGWPTTKEMYAALGPKMSWLLDSGAYPRFERYILDASKNEDADARFAVGLECVLDGVAARFDLRGDR
jgi:AcrR family transcriptional regulator